MAPRIVRRVASACVLASAMALLGGTGTASADTFTKVYHGEGSSSWGFSVIYARAQVWAQARGDGFDISAHCVETAVDDHFFWAEVTWECSREV